MCAPSIPPDAEPSLMLSRVTGHDFCFSSWTSFIPYFSKRPFSLAIISGAESVRAINPNLAWVVSTFGALAAGPVLVADEPLASDFEVLLPEEQPWTNKEAAVAALAVMMNCRLENLVIADFWMLFSSLKRFPIHHGWEVKSTYSDFQMNRPHADLSPCRREALIVSPSLLGKGLGVRSDDCGSYN